jgi:hypothetical protein
MTVRVALVFTAVLAFAGLGVVDLLYGNWRVGVASICLAGANALLLTDLWPGLRQCPGRLFWRCLALNLYPVEPGLCDWCGRRLPRGELDTEEGRG